jgi:hypothetical protein
MFILGVVVSENVVLCHRGHTIKFSDKKDKGAKVYQNSYPWHRELDQNSKYFSPFNKSSNLETETLLLDDPDPIKKKEFDYIVRRPSLYFWLTTRRNIPTVQTNFD